MTWKQIKLATMQKIFSANGNEIVDDESTKDYLAAMPQAANEALVMCLTSGKLLKKCVKFTQLPVENLLTEDTRQMVAYKSVPQEYVASNACSWVFEVWGVGIAKVYQDSTLLRTEMFDTQEFTTFRGTSAKAGQIVIVFDGEYPFYMRNVAIYAEKFRTETEVPSWAKQQRVNLKTTILDYYSLSPEDTKFVGIGVPYETAQSYWFEGNGVFVMDRDQPGEYYVYYNAYSPEITAATLDTYELPIDPEIAAILPLYMASQIYKEDDIAVATSYRNEFETAFERLNLIKNTEPCSEAFESGWC